MKHEADIRVSVQRLSKETLDQLYDTAFKQIVDAGAFTHRTAVHAFSWLLCVRQPLRSATFLDALAVTEPAEAERLGVSRLLGVCFNLIVHDQKLDILRFAHISFQEFLEARPEFTSQHVHRLTAASCLSICMRDSNIDAATVSVDNLPIQSIGLYASLYWAEHCRFGQAAHEECNLLQKMEEFVFEDDQISLSFLDWLEDIQHISKSLRNDHPLKKATWAVTNPNNTPLFTACAFGLAKLIDCLARDDDFDWNQKNHFGQTGIYLACAFGYENIVRLLLGRGADLNAGGGRYLIPLHAASFAGHLHVVRALLEHGAQAHVKGVFENALQAALMGDHEDVAVMILQSGYGIANQEDYDSIFKQAAERGFVRFIDIFSTIYPLFRDFASPQRVAVEGAILKGRLGVLRRLLERSPNAIFDLPNDAISTAALSGQNTILNLLLESGKDIEQEGKFGTPLRAACLMGHESTVRFLLDRGAKVDVCGSFGSALQASAMKGHTAIAQVLIQEGADVDLHSGFYGNALQAAAYQGHENMVQTLVKAGANIHQQGYSKDAIYAAAEGGNEALVRFLLDKARVKVPEFFFSSAEPLCSRDIDESKRVLRDESPSRRRNSQSKEGSAKRWPTHASVPNLPLIFETLNVPREAPECEGIQLPSGNDYNIDGGRNCILQAAAFKNHDSVVKTLLENSTGYLHLNQVNDAFKEASTKGNEKLVRLILNSKFDMKPCLNAALEGAALSGHSGIVNVLLAYESVFRSSDEVGSLLSHNFP